MSITDRIRACLGRFRRKEDGSFTSFGLYVTTSMAIVGGIAIDYQNLIAVRTQLQVTADLVAHAALYNREVMGADEAIAEALDLVEAIQPRGAFGDVLSAEDIRFGTYDPENDAFTVDTASRDAVMVSTARLLENGNPVSAFLMQFVGLATFDVISQSVYVADKPSCLRGGFTAEGIVDIQSNNAYYDGFCIHSNTYVSLNSNNYFEPGTTVSMPDTSDLDLPASGFASNDGLGEALSNRYYRMRLLNRIDDEIAWITTYGSHRMPSYITTPVVNYVHGTKIDISDLQQNAYNVVTCNGGKVTFTPDVTMQNMVVSTNCEITFGNGTILDNAIVIGTAPDQSSSIKGSHLQVGRNDNCAPDGGAIIISKGGMTFASKLQAFGGQLIALGDIQFAANAGGIEGASFISGRTISGTSNMTMGFCEDGMEHILEASYFRLAR